MIINGNLRNLFYKIYGNGNCKKNIIKALLLYYIFRNFNRFFDFLKNIILNDKFSVVKIQNQG